MPETTVSSGQSQVPSPPTVGFSGLFLGVCRALACGALRLKPRERQLALLLAVESFGRGEDSGVMDLDGLWRQLQPGWRRNELQLRISGRL